MRLRTLLLFATAALAVGVIGSIPRDLKAQAQGPVALGGVVRSQAEGPMEGVVVNARRDGANFTVSVVSDAQGKYSFPRTHLEPGKYVITMRAVGYDLKDPGPADVVAGKTASVDLELQKSRDLASQLSSLEWAMSIPGTTEQKDKLVYQTVSCAYCHTWKRVMKSKHTGEELVAVMTRMQTYFTDGTAVSDDGRGRGQKNMPDRVAAAAKNANWGNTSKQDLADYIATLNLSGGRTTWPFELKTLPRPTGKATRVIITQYDMPRPDTVSHDLDLDSKGTIWYTDESRMFFGKMDPKTGKFTEYPLPAVPPGDLPGARDIQVDKEDNVWFPRRIANAAVVMTRFNPKTEELSTIEGAGGQFLAMGPDGKIWAGFKRIDPKTMKVDATYTWNDSPNQPPGTARPVRRSHRRRLQGEPVGAGLSRLAPHPRRRRDEGGEVLARADSEFLTAPQPHGRAGSLLVRRVHRRQDRHVRHTHRTIPGVADAAQVHHAVRRVGSRPERLRVCHEQHGRAPDPPRSEDGRDDPLSDPDRLRLEEDRPRPDDGPLDAVDGQHAQRADHEGRAAGLTE